MIPCPFRRTAPGQKRGMAGSGTGVGVIVIAVGEVRPVVEQEALGPLAELIPVNAS